MSPAVAPEGVAQGLGYRRTGPGLSLDLGFRVRLALVDAHPEHGQASYGGVPAKPGNAQHDQKLALHLTCNYFH